MTGSLLDHVRDGVPLEGSPIIDIHAHIDNMANIELPALSEQLSIMQDCGVQLAAVSSCLALCGEIVRGNDRVAVAVGQHPERLIGLCHVNVNFPELSLSELFRCFSTTWFHGIKVHQFGRRYDDIGFGPIWEWAAARCIFVLAHTWEGELFGLDQAARDNPRVIFVAAHAGSESSGDSYIRAASTTDNLYFDTSEPCAYYGLLEKLVHRIGADRIVFGSDAHCISLPFQIAKVLTAKISDADKSKILFENAWRLIDGCGFSRRSSPALG